MSCLLLPPPTHVLERGLDGRFGRTLGAPNLTCVPFSLTNEEHHTRENNKNTYFIRWINTMPCATARSVFRRCLCDDGPGIGDVILAIIARMCSSLHADSQSRQLMGPLAKRFCPTLTCALVGLEGSRGIASDSLGPFAGYSPS